MASKDEEVLSWMPCFFFTALRIQIPWYYSTVLCPLYLWWKWFLSPKFSWAKFLFYHASYFSFFKPICKCCHITLPWFCFFSFDFNPPPPKKINKYQWGQHLGMSFQQQYFAHNVGLPTWFIVCHEECAKMLIWGWFWDFELEEKKCCIYIFLGTLGECFHCGVW